MIKSMQVKGDSDRSANTALIDDMRQEIRRDMLIHAPQHRNTFFKAPSRFSTKTSTNSVFSMRIRN